MSKFTIESDAPKTQSIEAVKSLIEYFDGSPCARLPAKVQLSGGWILVLSSKKDQYYVTSRDACSCPSFVYRRRCRHVQALRDQEGQKEEQELSPTQIFARDIVVAMES